MEKATKFSSLFQTDCRSWCGNCFRFPVLEKLHPGPHFWTQIPFITGNIDFHTDRHTGLTSTRYRHDASHGTIIFLVSEGFGADNALLSFLDPANVSFTYIHLDFEVPQVCHVADAG